MVGSIPELIAVGTAIATRQIPRQSEETGDRLEPGCTKAVRPLIEAGYPEATSVSWFGLHAPAGTPAAALDRIALAVKAATSDPEVVEKIKALGAEVAYLDKPGFEKFIAGERSRAEKYAAVIKGAAQQ